VVLQVAALTRENDALALAEALQQKQYSAFVLTPAGDNLYRVQVGPYADAKSADAAKRSLEREGFKAIVRR
jgi:cell division septation protein DedD